MITRLAVKHYKSLEDLDLKLDRLTVLVGPNGVGKSNVVDVLKLVRDSMRHGLERAIAERHGIGSIRQWSARKPYHVSVDVSVESPDGTGRFKFTLASRGGHHVVHAEVGEWRPVEGEPISYERGKQGKVDLALGGGERGSVTAEGGEELFLSQFEARPFRSLRQALEDFEAYLIFPNVLRAPQKPAGEHVLSWNADNLASVFQAMTRSKKFVYNEAREEIILALRKLMPNLESIRIQRIGGLMVPAFRVMEAGKHRHDFNVSQISDGTLRVLGLLTALYQPNRPSVMAMEEPEQTVHPGVLSILADSFVEVSQSTQLLITTHSPELVDSLGDPELIRAVDMVDGITLVQPIASAQKQAVKERLFALGELMSAEGLHS